MIQEEEYIRMHHSNGLVEIKHTSRLYGNEDFVLAQQCQQVYYTCPPDNKSSKWWAVIKTTARSRYNVDMGEFIKDDNNMRSFDLAQSDEISQPCRVLPTQTLDDPNMVVEASYYTEINHCELLQLQANSIKVERASDEEFDDDDVNVDYDDDDVVMSDYNDEQHDDDIL
jgi:hypothetical protein